jgi:hypothetical protein
MDINGLYNGLFSSRPTMEEAYDYAWKVAKASDNPAAVMAAVQVVVNTLVKQLQQVEEGADSDGRISLGS